MTTLSQPTNVTAIDNHTTSNKYIIVILAAKAPHKSIPHIFNKAN